MGTFFGGQNNGVQDGDVGCVFFPQNNGVAPFSFFEDNNGDCGQNNGVQGGDVGCFFRLFAGQ